MALPALRLAGPLPRAGVDGVRARWPSSSSSRNRRSSASTANRSSRSTSSGSDFSKPFDFLGIDFGQDVGTLLFITAALGVVGVLVVWLHKSRFGRRLTALGDSPAASATVGVNPIYTKLGVFVDLGRHRRVRAARCSASSRARPACRTSRCCRASPYLLLLVVGGVAVVSGAVLGGLPAPVVHLDLGAVPGQHRSSLCWSRLGPGLAGIGIGRQPSGVIPTVGEDLRAQNARKRAEREAAGLPPAPRPDTTPPAPQPPGVEQQAPVSSPGA